MAYPNYGGGPPPGGWNMPANPYAWNPQQPYMGGPPGTYPPMMGAPPQVHGQQMHHS